MTCVGMDCISHDMCRNGLYKYDLCSVWSVLRMTCVGMDLSMTCVGMDCISMTCKRYGLS